MKNADSTKPVRKLGTLRGQIKINDPNWWKPMTDKEVEEFLGDETFNDPQRLMPKLKSRPKPQR
jgi:hypothetical protein